MECPNTEDLTELYNCFRDMDAGEMSLQMSHFVVSDQSRGKE